MYIGLASELHEWLALQIRLRQRLNANMHFTMQFQMLSLHGVDQSCLVSMATRYASLVYRVMVVGFFLLAPPTILSLLLHSLLSPHRRGRDHDILEFVLSNAADGESVYSSRDPSVSRTEPKKR